MKIERVLHLHLLARRRERERLEALHDAGIHLVIERRGHGDRTHIALLLDGDHHAELAGELGIHLHAVGVAGLHVGRVLDDLRDLLLRRGLGVRECDRAQEDNQHTSEQLHAGSITRLALTRADSR